MNYDRVTYLCQRIEAREHGKRIKISCTKQEFKTFQVIRIKN